MRTIKDSNKLRAVVYARVSTDKEEQKTSLKLQKEYYTQYAKNRGFELIKVYYDEGLSATSSNRKAFIKMLEDAGLEAHKDGSIVTFKTTEKEPMFDWIIVKDVDRFARNTDTIAIIRALRDKNVYIIFENLNFTTNDNEWEMRVNLFLLFAQQESLDKSRKLRDSYLKRAEKGEFFMSVNLFGYGKTKDKKEHYIIEDEAHVVRMIFDYYTKDKLGSYEIGDLLNKQGYKTKQGKRWNGNSVLRVLRNEKYKGQVILNRYGKTDITGSNKRVINPKNEWIILNDAIPKIVSIEQFDKAQKIMESRTRTTVKYKGSDKRQVRGQKIIKNIFYQKIWCGQCGADYIRQTSIKNKKGEKVTEYYYGCRNRTNKARKNKKCMNKGISHNVLTKNLIEIAKNFHVFNFGDKELIDEQLALEKKLDQIDKMIENSEQKKAEIDKEISKIDEQISNLFATLASGVSDTVMKLTQKKIEELEELKKKLEASKTNFDLIELENKKKEYINKFDKIWELQDKKEYTFDELLKQINKIEIMDDKRVIVKFLVPTLQHTDDAKRVLTYMFTR